MGQQLVDCALAACSICALSWPITQAAVLRLLALCVSACRARLRVQGYTFLDWLQLFLPCVRWLRTYRVKEFLLVRATPLVALLVLA